MHRILLLLVAGSSALLIAGCGSEPADPEPRAPVVDPGITEAPEDLAEPGAAPQPSEAPGTEEAAPDAAGESPRSESTTLEMPPEDYQAPAADSDEEGGFDLPPDLNAP